MAWWLMIWRSGVLFEMCLSGLCHDCFPSVPLFLNPQFIAKHALHLTSCYETLDPSSQCRSLHDEWGAGSWNLSNVWESKVVAMSGGPWCCPWSRFFMVWHLVMKEVMCMIVDNLRTIEHKSIWQVWQFRIIIMALSLEILYPDHMSWTQALRPSSGRYNKVLWEIQEYVYNMSWHEIGSGRLSKPLRANFTTDGVAVYYILKWSVRNLVIRGHSAKPM